MKTRLGRKIKTVDDLLSQDDVLWLIGELEKEKADLTGIIAIKIDRQGISQILTTLDRDGTMATLSRAGYNYALDERLGRLENMNE